MSIPAERTKSVKLGPTKAEGQPLVDQIEARVDYGDQGGQRVTSTGTLSAVIHIGNTDVSFLVDTGAATTFVSFETWEGMCPAGDKVVLEEVGVDYAGVDGRPLQMKGKGILFFKFQTCEIPVEVVVANISTSALLGVDFLRQHECSIQFGPDPVMYIGRARLAVPLRDTSPQAIVALVDTVVIPAESETVVPGVVELEPGYPPSRKLSCGLLEPKLGVSEKRKVMVARVLVDATREVVPVRLFNTTADPITLYRGTHVGTVSPISGVVEGEVAGSPILSELPLELEQLLERSGEGLEECQRLLLRQFLQENRDVFSCSGDPMGRTGLVKHYINTGDAAPIRQPPRRLPHHKRVEAQAELDVMIEEGVVSPSKSAWSSPVVLVRKADLSLRFCIDYRRVNSITRKDAFPLPRIDDSLDALSGAKWFSTLDLRSGYWQVEMEDTDKEKTAFSMGSGLYEFNVLPFGLCNAPATFQRLMEQVLRGLHWQTCLIYIDDIIIFSSTPEEHFQRLREVFDRLRMAGLRLKPSKCELLSREVRYLGHIVSDKGVSTDSSKIEAVQSWPTPTTIKQLRGFLGLCSYYRRFIRDFAAIAAPLHGLTRKGQKFFWSDECEERFRILKAKLTTAPTLAYPNFSEMFILDTDASNEAIGAVLSQVVGGEEHPVAYASRTLSNSERKYSVTRKELLAVVNFIKHFRPYLYGRRFLLRTDHGSLRWLYNFKSPEGQVARWLEVLGTYDFQIETRPGRVHANADALSRSEPPLDPQSLTPPFPPAPLHLECCNMVVADSNWVESCTGEQVREFQLKDDCIGPVLKWKEDGIRPPWEQVSGLDRVVKAYWGQWDLLSVRGGILYRRWVSNTGAHDREVIVLPRAMREEVLYELHNSPTGGHLGQRKTRGKVSTRYYWFGMRREVENWCRRCELCARRKPPNPRTRAQMKVVEVGEPLQRVAIDVLGPLPETYRGNKYIVVLADYFTRWTEAFPVPNQEAATVASVVAEHFIARFGVPQMIHTDQGSNFESALFRELCNLLGIEKTRTTAYRPQSDGLVERFNRTLEQMLSVYVHENQKDWDLHLPFVLMAFRSSPQETTGFSPNLLMLGRETTLPVELIIGPPVDSEAACSTTSEYVAAFAQKCEKAFRITREHNVLGTERQKRLYDARITKVAPPFSVNEKVWLAVNSKKRGRSPKLQLRWSGPHVITHKLSDCLYRIKYMDTGKLKVVHVDRLKKYMGPDDRDDSAVSRSSARGTDVDEPLAVEESSVGEVDMAESIDEMVSSETEEGVEPLGRRRRPPVWMRDYEQY